MGAIIKSRPEFHKTILDKYANVLIGRFKERTLDVKIELFENFTHLILGHAEERHVYSVDLELKHRASVVHNSSF